MTSSEGPVTSSSGASSFPTPSVNELGPVRVARPEPASSEVAKALLDYILSERLQRGERLPSERKLSEAFGVGRSAVREGLKSLGLLGLIEFRHGSGTYVSESASSLLPRVIEWGLLLGEPQAADLVETRQMIEVFAAELAAKRRTDAQMDTLEEIFQRLTQSKNVEEYVARDVEFHLSIADASGNSALSSILTSISSLLYVWTENVIRTEHRRVFGANPSARWPTRRAVLEHRLVLDAIRLGDATAARSAMSAHMVAAAKRLTQTIAARTAERAE